MDTNLERLGINQKKKKKIKAATVKANIPGLLNILKTYYANTHQDPPKPTINEGTNDLQLAIDTRQALANAPRIPTKTETNLPPDPYPQRENVPIDQSIREPTPP